MDCPVLVQGSAGWFGPCSLASMASLGLVCEHRVDGGVSLDSVPEDGDWVCGGEGAVYLLSAPPPCPPPTGSLLGRVPHPCRSLQGQAGSWAWEPSLCQVGARTSRWALGRLGLFLAGLTQRELGVGVDFPSLTLGEPSRWSRRQRVESLTWSRSHPGSGLCPA